METFGNRGEQPGATEGATGGYADTRDKSERSTMSESIPTVIDLSAHPAAELLPMMSDDELRALAEADAHDQRPRATKTRPWRSSTHTSSVRTARSASRKFTEASLP